ncbi:peptidoglycan DD-metalloendopeptidase family protein [Alexandriicola marinus]|uniref:peptidoglycan DD-metalloendopeptidase family protein n=1 Tax=Alexandriicola marinus TaxID=2081710 RepID=UPI001EEEAAE7|nr:peptidoglycan DD-metalloendopeptidase family protein [Alexandriicola marinus]
MQRPFYSFGPAIRRGTLLACSAALLAACSDEPFDLDLRDLTSGFDTTAALAATPTRPAPDNRGVISYPNYQVVVARRGDTVRTIAARLGLDADQLARYNGIDPDVTLRRDEIIALPVRVAEPSPATGASVSGPIQPPSEVDVTTIASDAIDRAGDVTTEPTVQPAAQPSTPEPQTGVEPIRHQVIRGETIYSIARVYGTDVGAIAEWNGLGSDLSIREGQFLLIPVPGAAPPPATSDAALPGEGSATPVPPSAAAPLPDENPEPVAQAGANDDEVASEAPDLGSEQSQAAPSDAPMIYPVTGTIIRDYARGRNEGIDIGVAAGTPVRAAAAGTVAAITTDTAGIQIVVIRHPDNLLTVYTHVDALQVERNQQVSQGTVIGSVLAGDPSFLHFEVRQGTDSVDPSNFLP